MRDVLARPTQVTAAGDPAFEHHHVQPVARAQAHVHLVLIGERRHVRSSGALHVGIGQCAVTQRQHRRGQAVGGSFGMPHAETHAVMIPHTTAFNAVAVPELLKPLSDIFGGSAGGGLYDFAHSLGAPMSLAGLGFAEADLEKAAELATLNPYTNPRQFGRDQIRALLQDAWSGERPRT